ncbi:phosphate ABC transporter permease subunit PstC [Anaeromyxobacter diazotrophicus]|uniref:Phosphate transport system permease protein n=1 Tax=Anaeromyxobacter diazotrophicus TaxID=2590199 RepID=A0A7I9VHG0_9BACT|nr:phosphate ABC transporter permease subunit PstC [Anaeromyxobacter diazotrophicus]GEJ55832.1 phosphate transport system permease protein [Anaeromyxobacter diazotrophicus]
MAPPRPPRAAAGGHAGDRLFAAVLTALGGAVLLVVGVVVLELYRVAQPALAKGGLRFLLDRDWDPVLGSFGALPFVYGTLVTSGVALLVAVPVSVGLALFLSEMGPPRLRPIVSFLIETLAAIPSVVYGLWGLFVVVPLLRDHVEPALGRALGFLPLFRGAPIGLGYLAAGLLLAIMILPTISSVTSEVLKTVPSSLREGALALGATRWEAIRLAVLPYARPGILGAVLLGLGRALGETMAVTMVIGNAPEISASLFAPGYSLPAVIANEFAEASGALHLGALAGLALVLFGLALVMNSAARLLVRLVARGGRAAA